MVLVAVVLPCGHFVGEDLLVSDAAIETLRRENAEFGFGQVEPAAVLGGVMPFEPLDEPAGLAVYDISTPETPRRIGFMWIEGGGIDRIWIPADLGLCCPPCSTALPTTSS